MSILLAEDEFSYPFMDCHSPCKPVAQKEVDESVDWKVIADQLMEQNTSCDQRCAELEQENDRMREALQLLNKTQQTLAHYLAMRRHHRPAEEVVDNGSMS